MPHRLSFRAMNTHNVRFVHTGVECSVEDGTTILQAVDSKGITLSRGCHYGSCGHCALAVRTGVEHLMNRRTKQPIANADQVRSCVAKIHGDIEVEL